MDHAGQVEFAAVKLLWGKMSRWQRFKLVFTAKFMLWKQKLK